MNKSGVTKQATTSTETSGQQFDMDVFAARSRFFAVTLGMGWRLALTVLIPLVAGIKLDDKFNSSPSYTLAGFMIAIAGACMVVWNTVKQVNEEQAEMDAEKSKQVNKKDKKA